MHLQGKIALVTGGSRGIGKALAVGLAEVGANVAVGYHKNSTLALEIVDKIKRMGKKAIAVQGDVSQKREVQKLVDNVVDVFGIINVLVNNAAVQTKSCFWELSEEEWDRIVDVNLKGTFLVSQCVSRLMMEQGWGRIINISSICGEIVDIPGFSHYSASKGGVNMLTKAMAVELAPYGINVNAIAPGAVRTEMTKKVENEEGGYIKRMIAATPCRCIGEPEDIVGAVIFLSSEKAKWITGQIITIDGGYTLQ